MCTRLQIHARFKLPTVVKTKNLLSKIFLIGWQPCGRSLRWGDVLVWLERTFTEGDVKDVHENREPQQHEHPARWRKFKHTVQFKRIKWFISGGHFKVCFHRHKTKRTCNTGLNRLVRHKLCRRIVSSNRKCVFCTLRKDKTLKKKIHKPF